MKNYSWDECAGKADKIIEVLIKAGHSGQDIMFIGTRLLQAGIYTTHRNAEQYVKADPCRAEEKAKSRDDEAKREQT